VLLRTEEILQVIQRTKCEVFIIASLLITFCLCIQNESFGQGVFPRRTEFTTKKVAQAGFTFLEIGVGARVEGMGAVGSVLTNDPVLLFWNPAGIGMMDAKAAFYAGYTPWFADIIHQSGAFVLNLGNIGVVGVSFINMDYGTIWGTEIAGTGVNGYTETGNVSDVGNSMIGFSYARGITDRLILGVTIKYVHESLTSKYTASIIAFDAGTNYDTGFKGTKIAMAAFNAGRQHTYIEETTELPLTFRVGVITDLGQIFNMSLPNGHCWTLAVEGNNPRDYSERIHVGTEYLLANIIALRAGYKFNYDYENVTLGFGIRLEGIGIDYSFNDMGEYLGCINRVSINAVFKNIR